MAGKRIACDKTNEEVETDERLGNNAVVDNRARRQLAIESLLEIAPVSLNDKVTMVKTAHHVDKDRFQIAFQSLMNTPKS